MLSDKSHHPLPKTQALVVTHVRYTTSVLTVNGHNIPTLLLYTQTVCLM